MRHRESYIQAVEDALACKTQAGEAALVVIARNWVREAMDPESDNYSMALKELHKYVLGEPDKNVNVHHSTSLLIEPTPDALAMMGFGTMSRNVGQEVIEVEARVLPSQEVPGGHGD